MRGDLNILLYLDEKEGAGARVLRVIESLLPENGLEICRTIKGVADKLRQPFNNFFISVLLVAQREELNDLVAIRDLLFETNIILILPDSEYDTTSIGHKLYPRYSSYVDSDFLDG